MMKGFKEIVIFIILYLKKRIKKEKMIVKYNLFLLYRNVDFCILIL